MSKITSLNNFNEFNNNNIIIEETQSDQRIVNISNEEEFSICQRCKQKESVFSCIVCDSFKLLCTKCDNYIHSLPSKQAHQRLAILTINRVNEKKKKDDFNIINMDQVNTPKLKLNNLNTNNSIDLNYKFNLNPVNIFNSYSKEKESITTENETIYNDSKNCVNTNINKNSSTNNIISSNYTSILDRNNYNVGSENNIFGNYKENINNDQQRGNYIFNVQENNTNAFNTFRIPNSQNFSREYVYEIKVPKNF